MPSAWSPILSDSTSATTPRTSGSRRKRWRLSQETSGNDWTSISPSFLRTATAQVDTPRIITPSSTAWPPTGASRCAISAPSERRSAAGTAVCPLDARGGGALLALGGAALEALDAAAGVDELLPPRVERVAVRADLDVDLGLGRARRELVAARAAHVGLDVLGMDSGLHLASECSGQMPLAMVKDSARDADELRMGRPDPSAM